MEPLGCDLKYHPWSGRKLSSEDTAFFNQRAFLSMDGIAGGSDLDGKSLAEDATRRFTVAKIQALKSLMAK